MKSCNVNIPEKTKRSLGFASSTQPTFDYESIPTVSHRCAWANLALNNFKEILAMPKNPVTRDAAIHRFEFTVEAIWKLLQIYLDHYEGINLASPKSVIRASFPLNILNEEQTSLGLKMIDDRNLTVHTYNEQLAESIYANLPAYYELLENLVKKIESEL